VANENYGDLRLLKAGLEYTHIRMKWACQTFKPEEDIKHGTKEKKTEAELVTLVMDKIREYPEYHGSRAMQIGRLSGV
jgi:hypothetical protein